MSDTSAHSEPHPDTSQADGATPASGRRDLWMRLLYMVVFWFLGNVAFSVAIFLGAVQFVVILVTGEKNEELRAFSRNLVQYVWECLAFVIFAREDKPFPLGKFPSVSADG
ncbi:DUF4389 domain-containing protein [uncultured Parvibaculum sp.]|uniref:DUF4389 domain-containing protein n=1 Tax=uncultured Parvibaculum sp. TaxID=291828 RepID=UPI0030EF3997|tara:strand:- start:58934 stop:59266 length:333 start_codon:yes stop_codon:yes gene_type:complete